MNFISSTSIIPALSRTKSENMLQNVSGMTCLPSSWGSLTDSPSCCLHIYNVREFWVCTSCWETVLQTSHCCYNGACSNKQLHSSNSAKCQPMFCENWISQSTHSASISVPNCSKLGYCWELLPHPIFMWSILWGIGKRLLLSRWCSAFHQCGQIGLTWMCAQ